MTSSTPFYHSYMDTRSMTAHTSPSDPLPLLTALRQEDQASVTHFVRLLDRHMALAAALLKYVFIHRTAKIPWGEVFISRTPPPHKRPFWDPGTARSRSSSSNQLESKAASAVEFNVSHQAGLVALAGCPTTYPPSSIMTTQDGSFTCNPTSTNSTEPESPRIGIDITCVSETSRSPSNIKTATEFSSWVDIFGDVFSTAEIHDMKTYEPQTSTSIRNTEGATISDNIPLTASTINTWTQTKLIRIRLRRFYTFFALKEAYVKMTGEALLVTWLKELEFRNVNAPPEVEGEVDCWGQVVSDVEVWFRDVQVPGLQVEVVAFGKDFILAVVARGKLVADDTTSGQGTVGDGNGLMLGHGLKAFDIERDVRQCAEGRCGCLNAQL